MATKTKRGRNNILIVALLTIIFAFSFTYFSIQNKNKSINPTTQDQNNKIFSSSLLKFSIEVPENYQIEDREIIVDVIKGNKKITIIRNGTNYSNLKDYLSNFDSRRDTNISNEEKIKIKSYPAISRIIRYKQGNIIQKFYFIYLNNSVYIISTSSESLYPDLDKIARSFKYTP